MDIRGRRKKIRSHPKRQVCCKRNRANWSKKIKICFLTTPQSTHIFIYENRTPSLQVVLVDISQEIHGACHQACREGQRPYKPEPDGGLHHSEKGEDCRQRLP